MVRPILVLTLSEANSTAARSNRPNARAVRVKSNISSTTIERAESEYSAFYRINENISLLGQVGFGHLMIAEIKEQGNIVRSVELKGVLPNPN